MQNSVQDTKLLGGVEVIAVWTLPRIGVAVRNDPLDLRLRLGNRELHYTPSAGWRATGFTWAGRLPAPQLENGSLHVSLDVLKALGVPLNADTPSLLDFAAPDRVPDTTLPPSGADSATTPTARPAPGTVAVRPTPRPPVAPTPELRAQPPAPAPTVSAPLTPVPVAVASIRPVPIPLPTAVPSAQLPTGEVVTPGVQTKLTPVANLDTVRVSRTMFRTVEVQRVVLELSHVAPYSISREASGLSVTLTGVSSEASAQTLPSGDDLTVQPTDAGTVVHLSTGGGRSEIFKLDDPYRVVIDTTTYTDPTVPPPLNPDDLPDGVTYRNKGTLHLLSFDPARFQARVVTAPVGHADDVASLVRQVGGVAGVNGGYFDPASSLPVDLVAVGGLMTSGSLERRATVGFTARGEPMFGYPRPRYVVTGAFGSVTVNSVRTQPDPNLLTVFVGDGRTHVGDDAFTTLFVTPGAGTVARALTGDVVPPAGTLALTFDPQKFPQLPRAAGATLTVTLNWQARDAAWPTAVDALSAGPLLVQDGKVVINAQREGFNTSAGVWRPTRQVALGTLAGQPTIAYFEYGTPEAFAAALAGAGLRDAVRMDSGSSATAYLTGGFANLGGYLNTVWSRPVPNAIVFVPVRDYARR